MTDKDRNAIAHQAKILSSAIKGGSSKKDIEQSWASIFTDDTWAKILGVTIGVIGASLATIGTDWIKVAISKKK